MTRSLSTLFQTFALFFVLSSTAFLAGCADETCSGGDCNCNDGDCSFECTAGEAGCSYNCSPGTNCTNTCPDGNCRMNCSGDGACELDCPGGGCNLVCSPTSSSCRLTGCTDSCNFSCSGGSNCSNSCTDVAAGCSSDVIGIPGLPLTATPDAGF